MTGRLSDRCRHIPHLRGISLVGKTLACHARDHEFKSRISRQILTSQENGEKMFTLKCNYKEFKYKKILFPCGELHITVPQDISGNIDIHWKFEKNEEIFELLLLADALKRIGATIYNLEIPYFPFGRQDRVANKGEAFSLKIFVNLINQIEAKRVIINDPHSDVTTALLNNVDIIYQHEIFGPVIEEKFRNNIDDVMLVAVDGGATKKINKLSEYFNGLPVLQCTKKRDTKTGALSGFEVFTKKSLNGKICIMVDDICDGGGTFIGVAKELLKAGATKIVLMVTHGFFTKGMTVFDNIIDEVYTQDGLVYKK